jgi:murein DD-endopeptidase MepM/ murein hydrolase activator NlpD
MPGADPARIRRLRSQATDVIFASNTGDIAGSRAATLRMNASIGRYTRELNAAATELRQRQRGSARNVNVNSSWQVALQDMQNAQAEINRASRKRFNDKLRQEEARQASLGIGVPALQRIGGPIRRVSAIPMGGGIDSGIMPRALPSKEMLRDRVAGSQQRQPSRLDELQAAQQKQLAEEAKRAAGSLGRFGAAVEREEKRRRSLGIGAPSRASGSTQRGGAIPMGGQGGRPGMFNQYASPAGPGNPVGIGQFRAEQKRQQGQRAFFQGDARSAIGDALIGGAFPALFGQGFGASAGGALGGGLGGVLGGSFGFGLSLVGTAVGQAIDTTAKNLTDLASALKTPGDTMEALAKSGFHVSNSLKFQVQQLESVGRAYDAQTLVLQEVEKRLGPGSVRQLNALESEQRRLQEQWSSIAGTLQSELLPALVGFTGVIADTINVARGINTLPGAKQIGSALRGQGIGGAILTAANPLGGATALFDKLQRRGKAVAAGAAGNRQAAKPQDEFAAGTARVQESRKLADQIQSAYREAFSLQRQAHDLQRNGAILNRDIADYGYKKEREIFDLRQQAAEKQIENNRARAQNRIEGSDLNARQTFAAAVGFEQQLLTNVREVVRSRKEGEADIEQSRNRLELAMAKLNRDVEDYKRTNAREIEDIEQRKLSYVRSVEDYKMKVSDYVRDRTREAADLWKQAMTLPDMGAATAPGGSARAGAVMGPSSGTIAFTGATGVGTGPHLDVRWADGRPITSADADRFIRVAGEVPSWFGVTSGYGPRRAPTAGASSFHKGVDFGTPTGTPVSLVGGARLVGSMTEAQSGGGGIVGIIDTPMGQMKLLHLEKVLKGNIQGQTATQISNIPGPKFSPVPIGPTPSIAPVNAANLAANLQLKGGTREAQQILEEQNKLKQKGIELGQIEQILQASQLPQLRQQSDTLKQQIEARQKTLDLSDSAASVADIEAESRARITQLELDRSNALAKIKKQYGDDPALTGMVNKRADLAVGVAKNEEKQRRINLDLNNKLQNQKRAGSAILQLQETLATGKAEAAALERGKLQASNVELLKASELYRLASEAEKTKLALLTAQTEELSKQNEFRKRINEIRNEARFTGAGLRAGMIGAPARAFEEEMKRSGNIDRATGLANETKLLENQQLAWGNLEKNIVATSDAISGALTNGLVSIVDGSRKIEDVGRDMLRAISSSFADSAQQQLTTLLQRQMGGLFQAIASQGLLSGLGGAGAGGLGGGLGAALSGSLGNIGSAFSAPTFGGFMAKGGITKPGEVYVTGEKEPEFFFPGVTGRVVPRSDMQKAEALRNSGNESDSLDISYTVREERGERYVTEDQLRKSNAMVERRAFAKTINGMKNNGALRDSINI